MEIRPNERYEVVGSGSSPSYKDFAHPVHLLLIFPHTSPVLPHHAFFLHCRGIDFVCSGTG
jgi:hypothetical protein